MATPLRVFPTRDHGLSLATDRGRLWRTMPQGDRAVVMRAEANPDSPARPVISRGRFRHVIAVVVPGDAVSLDIFDWVNRERVDRAKLLLETTDHPVADIAAMVGFGSPETLRRNFQRHVGTTARSYRHKFRHATPSDRD